MSICSKEHYELCIKILKEQPVSKFIDQDYLVETLCRIFKEDNPNFNEEKFLNALKER